MQELINNSVVLSVISFIAGSVVTVGVSLFFYRLSIREPIPAYYTQEIKLLSNKDSIYPKEIKVIFRDKEIMSLYKTYIFLWNNGRITLRGQDIIENTLKISFIGDNVQILSYNIVKHTKAENNLRIDTMNLNEIEFTFDFLDTHDGACIEILHTNSSEAVIKGTIVGVPKGIKKYTQKESQKTKILKSMVALMIMIISISITFLAIFQIALVLNNLLGTVGVIIGTLFIFIPVLFVPKLIGILLERKPFPKKLRL